MKYKHCLVVDGRVHRYKTPESARTHRRAFLEDGREVSFVFKFRPPPLAPVIVLKHKKLSLARVIRCTICGKQPFKSESGLHLHKYWKHQHVHISRAHLVDTPYDRPPTLEEVR